MTKKETNKLDKLWRQAVKDHYGEGCLICNKKEGLNIHHYIGRRNRATRWYIPNGCSLCPYHHTFSIWSAHQNPEWFRKEMLDRRGTKWMKELERQSNKIFKGTYQDVLDHLEGKDSY